MTDPKDISYPEKSDARGSAKKYHKRQAYYFGRHNTPESYLLFALWKEKLLQTGEAPPVREVKALLGRQKKAFTHLEQCDAILEEREAIEERSRELDQREKAIRSRESMLQQREDELTQRQTLVEQIQQESQAAWRVKSPVMTAVATLLIASVVWILSSTSSPMVDGIPLSASEVDRVRGLRQLAEIKESVTSDDERVRKLEERRKQLIKLGPRDGKVSDEDGV